MAKRDSRRASVPRKGRQWALWSVLTVGAGLAIAVRLFAADQDKSLFLPGQTTHGHYQIELACHECHSTAFSDSSVLQNACERCHGAELKEAVDSHPEAKFRDPRNAARVAKLDARYCVTCHREHRPELVSSMGLSLPGDYCYRCHQDIAEERQSHAGLGFETCSSAGCHNFHDNRALYEDFLVEHAEEPAHLATAALPARAATKQRGPVGVDAPPSQRLPTTEQRAFDHSGHGKAGVACSKCHGTGSEWLRSPSEEVCAGCHDRETEGWKRGRHGMRRGSKLGAMAHADARLPMTQSEGHGPLTCNSCHSAHGHDTRRAATEACQGCHDDEHTRAYATSPHAATWRAEIEGKLPPGAGVSCATCHLPRVEDGTRVFVQHNQNDNLRPNEKMIRSVCNHCHGVGFAIDALADADLVRRNFAGKPRIHIASIDMAVARVRKPPQPSDSGDINQQE